MMENAAAMRTKPDKGWSRENSTAAQRGSTKRSAASVQVYFFIFYINLTRLNHPLLEAADDPCSFPSADDKGSPAEAGLEVGGSELACRSTTLTLPSPDRGTNIMF